MKLTYITAALAAVIFIAAPAAAQDASQMEAKIKACVQGHVGDMDNLDAIGRWQAFLEENKAELTRQSEQKTLFAGQFIQNAGMYEMYWQAFAIDVIALCDGSKTNGEILVAHQQRMHAASGKLLTMAQNLVTYGDCYLAGGTLLREAGSMDQRERLFNHSRWAETLERHADLGALLKQGLVHEQKMAGAIHSQCAASQTFEIKGDAVKVFGDYLKLFDRLNAAFRSKLAI